MADPIRLVITDDSRQIHLAAAISHCRDGGGIGVRGAHRLWLSARVLGPLTEVSVPAARIGLDVRIQ